MCKMQRQRGEANETGDSETEREDVGGMFGGLRSMGQCDECKEKEACACHTRTYSFECGGLNPDLIEVAQHAQSDYCGSKNRNDNMGGDLKVNAFLNAFACDENRDAQ